MSIFFEELLKKVTCYDRYCRNCEIVYWFEGMKTLNGQRTKCDNCGESLFIVKIGEFVGED